MITLLNRLGHCENYTYALELEAALADALEAASSVLTPKIVFGIYSLVFHSAWDNFDQLIRAIRGITSIHTAHGVMFQERRMLHNTPEEETPEGQRTLPEVER